MSREDRGWEPTDLEAYCYLKRFLPAGLRVQAEPSAAYFSEWSYCYRVLQGERLFAELRGDFRDLRPGALAAQALEILERAERT